MKVRRIISGHNAAGPGNAGVASDIMIQRGTDHAWVNRGGVTARLAVVLVDAVPKRGGHA